MRGIDGQGHTVPWASASVVEPARVAPAAHQTSLCSSTFFWFGLVFLFVISFYVRPRLGARGVGRPSGRTWKQKKTVVEGVRRAGAGAFKETHSTHNAVQVRRLVGEQRVDGWSSVAATFIGDVARPAACNGPGRWGGPTGGRSRWRRAQNLRPAPPPPRNPKVGGHFLTEPADQSLAHSDPLHRCPALLLLLLLLFLRL